MRVQLIESFAKGCPWQEITSEQNVRCCCKTYFLHDPYPLKPRGVRDAAQSADCIAVFDKSQWTPDQITHLVYVNILFKLPQHSSDELMIYFRLVEVCVSFIQADQHFLCAFEDTPHQCDLMLLLLYVGLVDTECIDPHQLSVLQLA
jgi:hypothetical protein